MLTAMGPWRLRSSGAQWDRTLAVEVQRCSLQSGAGEEDWRRELARSLAKRIGEEEKEKEEKEEKKQEGF